ncbi:GMC oxidoreductase [Ramaria rubella]|nr:GMC oxidoreductase [Ramaria rubella]
MEISRVCVWQLSKVLIGIKATSGEFDGIHLSFFSKLTRTQSASSGEHDVRTNVATGSRVDPPDPDFHGDSGPIVKAHPTWASEFEWPLVSAINVLGVSDSTHEPPFEAMQANAYYPPNSQGPNLFLVTGAHVGRIILERNTKEGLLSATGVEFVKDEKKYTAMTNREVILSAGIGKDVLSQFGIQQVVDLPGVRENLRECHNNSNNTPDKGFCFDQRTKDHMVVQATHEIDSTIETLNIKSDVSRETHIELYKTQEGLLTLPPCVCLAFIPTKSFVPEHIIRKWEDVVRATFNPNASATTGISKQYELQKDSLSDARYAQAEQDGFPWQSLLIHDRPFSRGTFTMAQNPDIYVLKYKYKISQVHVLAITQCSTVVFSRLVEKSNKPPSWV